MRVGIISLLGLSAPVVTEGIDYVAQLLFPSSKIYNIMIATNDEKVKRNLRIINYVTSKEYGNRVVNISKTLNITDFTNKNNISEFIDAISKIISEEENKYNLDRIILNITGGRKIETMLLYFVSMFDSKIFKIINIINKNVGVANAAWEAIKEKNPEQLRDEEIKEVFFPNPNQYEVIEVPRFILPSKVISSIYSTLTKEEINDEIVEILSKGGFIAPFTKGNEIEGDFVLNDLGKALLKAIERLMYG